MCINVFKSNLKETFPFVRIKFYPHYSVGEEKLERKYSLLCASERALNNVIAITNFSKKYSMFCLSALKETYTSVRIKFLLNAYVAEEI